jgi:hypothetical protein
MFSKTGCSLAPPSPVDESGGLATVVSAFCPFCNAIRKALKLALLALALQGLTTSDCKAELCTRHILANSSIDRRAQPQIAVERFTVLDFRRSLT